jgi:DNA-binding response OmpR family regulator
MAVTAPIGWPISRALMWRVRCVSLARMASKKGRPVSVTDREFGNEENEHLQRPAGAAKDLEEMLRDARKRFMDGFGAQCDSLVPPVGEAGGESLPGEDAIAVLHRMAGLAGTIGFPHISAKASELEEAASAHAMSHADLLDASAALRAALALDLNGSAPDLPSSPTPPLGEPMTVLLVEDEPVQRTITSAQLRALGHVAVGVASGEEVIEAAKKAKPDVILLDIELPGINGYAVCQLLKADPELAGIPVVFLTARGSVDDRLTGLSLGADDFLTKPLDARELALRLQRLDRRGQQVEASAVGGVLTYNVFHREATNALRRQRCALVVLRTLPEQVSDVAAFTREEIRRRDFCGQYDRRHVVALLPDLGGAAARDRFAVIVESCRANGMDGVYAGIAVSESAGARTLAELMEEADEALAIARYEGLTAAQRPDEPRQATIGSRTEPLVLVADDDPEVARIVDAHLGAVGYRRILTFDGSRALEEIRAQRPDVVVLDLMMPRMSGFEVLAGMRDLGDQRPRVIVLSARGREENVMRAFSLGADDFMLKPFNPQELLARITRLIKISDRASTPAPTTSIGTRA